MADRSILQRMQVFGVKQALQYLEKDPGKNLPHLLDLVDKYAPPQWYGPHRRAVREALATQNNWYELIQRIYERDTGMRMALFENFICNASLKGSALQNALRIENGCNIPWAILLDPTSACNLHCTGCWAAEYGHQLQLSYADIDSIIRQGKALGTYFYIYTGGEPLMRKKDLLSLCQAHPDCEFLAFTNGTLIDDAFCQDMLRVKNFIPAISLEGFEAANDGRRGKGIFERVQQAMALLLKNKCMFGVSVCYTSQNWEDISSEAFFDLLIHCGALFAWFFHYMPVGNAAVTDLLPTPAQREGVYHRIRAMRKTKPLFTMDFQNDAEYVGGCIAGGRNYLHINAKGDVEPCVFIHYSNVNIRNCTLLEALKSPLFMAYHDNQPFNSNPLRPCPMLENPECLRRMVKETGATSTDYLEAESVEHLCDKCVAYAERWQPTADKLWAASQGGQ